MSSKKVTNKIEVQNNYSKKIAISQDKNIQSKLISSILILSSILTIMGFIGLSSIRSMQNIMNEVIKFTGKYSIFIPLFAGMTGVISYWLVIINRGQF